MPTQAATAIRRSPMEHPRHQYPLETAALQEIVRSCGLVETIKWGKPCFTMDGRNIVLIQRFNRYIALMFFQGALLADPGQLLFRIGEHMQVPRQLRFTSVTEIDRLRGTIEGFIYQAIALERAGVKIERIPPADLVLPDEMLQRFEAEPALKEAFAALTPGRQKGYVLQIAAAKQSRTRLARIDKFAPWILAGKGWNE